MPECLERPRSPAPRRPRRRSSSARSTGSSGSTPRGSAGAWRAPIGDRDQAGVEDEIRRARRRRVAARRRPTCAPSVPGTPPSATIDEAGGLHRDREARHAEHASGRPGSCVFIRNVHWLHALATATSIVSFGPSSISAAKSTAYDTDIVEPLLASGRLTLKADVTAESMSRTAKR